MASDILDVCVLNLDGDFAEQVQKILENVRLTRREVENLRRLFCDLEQTLHTYWPGCKVMPFGSIVTGLGIRTSDADCYVSLPEHLKNPGENYVMTAKHVLRRRPRIFQQLFAITAAKVPIVKFFHVPTQCHCDVNFKSPSGVRNSQLIAYLLHMDKRALPFAILLKYWSKVHKLTGTNLVPNYALIMMTIFFLQQMNILPSVLKLQQRIDPNIVDNWNTSFNENYVHQTNNARSLYGLLGGFFEYYSTYRYHENIISPYTGTFDHLDVSKLLKDLALAQAEIMHIKSSYATVEQLELVKKECSGAKNVSPPFSAAKVNMKRGAYRNSGPIGLSLFEESFTYNDENKASCDPISENDYSLHYRSINCQQLEGNIQATGVVTDQTSNALSCEDDSRRQVPSTVDRPCDQLTAAASSVPINNNTYAQAAMKEDKEWTVVQKKVKKSKNRFAGKTGTVMVEPDEMFRAAERKVPVFISNVNENTCETDIVKYIHSKTQEKVILEKIAIKRQCNYSAYKFFVPYTKLSMFLDDKIWPQGVIFRRFVNFKVSRTNVTSGKQDGSARVQK